MVDFTKENIREQVENEATFAGPAVYDLLTFFHALGTQTDELSGQFVPITSVKPLRPSETQIFAVGIMPPSSNWTGRLLDRSATVQADTDAQTSLEVGTEQVLERGGVGISPDPIDHTTGGPGGIGSSTTQPLGPTDYSSLRGLSGDRRFWAKLVIMCNRLGVQAENVAMVMKSESNIKATAVNGKSNAKGLIQITEKTALSRGMGLTQEEFDNFENLSREQQLDAVEEFYRAGRGGPSTIRGKSAAEIKIKTFGGYNNGDGSIYDSRAGQKGFRRPERQLAAYKANRTHDLNNDGAITAQELFQKFAPRAKLTSSQQKAINQARRDLKMAEAPLPVRPRVNSSTDFQRAGSKDAGEARRVRDRQANRSVNPVGLGQRYSEAQAALGRYMRSALEQIANTPPLRLLVNPRSFRSSIEHISTDNWGRNGPIIEHWGDNQSKIEGSGKIAAYYALDAMPTNQGSAGNSPGLGRTARQFSSSYQNLLSLWLIYKNNGGVWFPDDFPDSETSKQMNLSVVGSVYIYFDSILYIGSFDSFNLTESETEPFSLEYNFSFTVRAEFLLDNLQNQSFTYGSDQITNLVRNQSALQATTAASIVNASTVNTEAPVALPLEDDPLAGINDSIEGDDPLASFGEVG